MVKFLQITKVCLLFLGKIILSIIPAGFYLVAVYATFNNSNTSGIICAYIIGLFFTWIIWLQHIPIYELSFWHLKIKLRNKIQQADKLIGALREQIIVLSKLMFIETYRPSTWGQEKITIEESNNLIPRFVEQLKVIGVDEQEIENIVGEAHQSNLAILSRPIKEYIRGFIIRKQQEINSQRAGKLQVTETERLDNDYAMYSSLLDNFNSLVMHNKNLFKLHYALNCL